MYTAIRSLEIHGSMITFARILGSGRCPMEQQGSALNAIRFNDQWAGRNQLYIKV